MKKIAALRNCFVAFLLLIISSMASAVVNITVNRVGSSQAILVTASGTIKTPSSLITTTLTGPTGVKPGNLPIFRFTGSDAAFTVAAVKFNPTSCSSFAAMTGGFVYAGSINEQSSTLFSLQAGSVYLPAGTLAGQSVEVADSFVLDYSASVTNFNNFVTQAGAAGTYTCSWTAQDGTTDSINIAVNTGASVSPTITAVSPSSGNIAGGTTTKVIGAGFTGSTAVTIGGSTLVPTSVTETSITFTTPAHAAGPTDVAVTTASSGVLTAPNAFTYVTTPAPTVTAISTTSGTFAGGTAVTITGTGFTGATSVKFGNTPVSTFTVVSSTSITTVTPQHAAGQVSVDVTTAGGNNAPNTLYTYVQPLPIVTSISPATGPLGGNVTNVTVSGSNFTGATGVTIGGVAATTVRVNSDTSISLTTPAGSAGAASVVVTTPSGANTANTLYTYAGAPTITSVSPNSGSTAGGTSVTISGTNFIGVTSVKFPTTAATSYVVNSATQITAVTPAHVAGAVNVVITTNSGTATSTNGYTYSDAVIPTASNVTATVSYNAISANIPLTTGNTPTSVAVSTDGSNGHAVATGTTIAYTPTTGYFGTDTFQYTATNAAGTSSAATATITISPPTLVANPAAGTLTAGTVGTVYTSITLTTNGGKSTYSYAITSGALPTGLALSGGVISGTPTAAGTFNFTVTATDSSTNTPATLATNYSIVVSMGTQATLTASAASTTISTNGTTTLSASGGSGTGAVTYAVSSGSCSISGTTLTAPASADTCTVTATKAADSTYASATSAAITVTVNTPAAPTVSAISPNSGTTAGGTSVTITGTNFTGATGVTIGGAAATGVTVVSATSITAITPAGSAGTASVVVTTPAGVNAGNTLFTYVAPAPTVSAISPNSGTTAGGTSVTITGTNFTGATGVTIGGAAATGVTVVSATSITAITPAGSAGTASVVVTTPAGFNAGNTLFTYVTPPTVTSLSPNSGTTAGGTSVTITGANFTGATGVTIGGAAATGVTVVSATSITATTPAGTAGTASVVVTTPAGSNAANTLFTYIAPAPTVSSLSPNSGTTAGGTSVTITGANFTGATGVTIGGAAATGVTVVSATSITATTPAGTAGTASVVVTTPAGSNAANTLFTYIALPTRKPIREAATDASVLAIHGAQIMESQKFVTTQIENVTNHLNGYRNNFNLRPSTFGFGVNLPSLGPASQALYKIKDELTPRPEMQAQKKLQSKDTLAGMKKVGYVEEQDLTPYNDYLREEELAAEKIKQEQMQEQKALQEQIDQSQYYAANSQYERENLTYSVWTAGTIDYANYKTGDNKETQNKLTANGLTMGIDYKLNDAAIVGAAVGVGTAWQSAVAINTNLKAKQTAITGYGMFGFADHWVVEGLMGYGVVDFSGNRTTSDGAAQLGVNRKGETLFSSGTISKMYWVEGYKVTPFVRQDVMHINLHSYAETGAADYALGFDSTNFLHTTTSGGLQVSRDIFLEAAKLTPTAKIALNRIRTGGLAQNIYYADTGAAGGVYTLDQSGSYMTTQSLGLGLIYTTRAGDGFDLGWQGAIGANQYKMNGLRFAVRFAM